jgi:hypothetical protein
MKIIKLEYIDVPQEFIDSGRSSFSQEDLDLIDEFDENLQYIELEDDVNWIEPTIGIFSEEFIVFIKSMCEKYEVKYKITDITDEYIYSSSAFEEFLNKYSDKRKDIEKYILHNTSVDDVLDKINKFGIDSMTEIDKKILG